MSTNTATVTADPWAGPKTSNSMAIKALIPLLITGCVPLIGVIYYLVIRKKIGE